MTSNRVRYNIAKTGRTIATLAAERLPIVHFDDEPAGKMATRITKDVDGIINLYKSKEKNMHPHLQKQLDSEKNNQTKRRRSKKIS